ncbi:uncharacterized protein LOC143112354 [Alosa pseudoharengus]|uniref:uncharacterized protein LOC143112354 n=1 Tax=Alosa pseudoharengus TaxID=34774 RepID=UPI003F8AC250
MNGFCDQRIDCELRSTSPTIQELKSNLTSTKMCNNLTTSDLDKKPNVTGVCWCVKVAEDVPTPTAPCKSNTTSTSLPSLSSLPPPLSSSSSPSSSSPPSSSSIAFFTGVSVTVVAFIIGLTVFYGYQRWRSQRHKPQNTHKGQVTQAPDPDAGYEEVGLSLRPLTTPTSLTSVCDTAQLPAHTTEDDPQYATLQMTLRPSAADTARAETNMLYASAQLAVASSEGSVMYSTVQVPMNPSGDPEYSTIPLISKPCKNPTISNVSLPR